MNMTNYEFFADAYKIPMREGGDEPDELCLGYMAFSWSFFHQVRVISA